MEIIIAIVAVLVGLLLGAIGGIFVRRIASSRAANGARSEAARIIEQAREQERQSVVAAKEEALKFRSEGEAEVRQWRSEVQRMERRVSNREENVEGRARNFDRKERTLTDRENGLVALRAELEELKTSELGRLEEVSNLSFVDAKQELMGRAEEDIQYDLARRYRDLEDEARAEANDKGRAIVAQAIQRLASEVVTEATLTTVPLPNDDMKGRLIGREGRNIRAIEKATGVDLIIDDTPEAVTLSCFDPIRREVARVALSKLITDGRIHPARIEEMTAKAQKQVDEEIWKNGEQAVFEVGVQGLHPEVIKLLGRLKFRFSFGENILQHSLEVSWLAGLMASEIGADVKIAKTGGLLHDLGKALSHEVEGPHAEIGADVATRYNVSAPICTAIGEHHDDEMSTVESFLVSAADAISAARPGARRDTVEHYMKRLEAIEEVSRSFDGVEKCFAIQAGREVRVLVNPQNVDDISASRMARDIAKKIEEQLVYPGQIKVIVIRESRAVEYAR